MYAAGMQQQNGREHKNAPGLNIKDEV